MELRIENNKDYFLRFYGFPSESLLDHFIKPFEALGSTPNRNVLLDSPDRLHFDGLPNRVSLENFPNGLIYYVRYIKVHWVDILLREFVNNFNTNYKRIGIVPNSWSIKDNRSGVLTIKTLTGDIGYVLVQLFTDQQTVDYRVSCYLTGKFKSGVSKLHNALGSFPLETCNIGPNPNGWVSLSRQLTYTQPLPHTLELDISTLFKYIQLYGS